jgi:hypothetical protein
MVLGMDGKPFADRMRLGPLVTAQLFRVLSS